MEKLLQPESTELTVVFDKDGKMLGAAARCTFSILSTLEPELAAALPARVGVCKVNAPQGLAEALSPKRLQAIQDKARRNAAKAWEAELANQHPVDSLDLDSIE